MKENWLNILFTNIPTLDTGCQMTMVPTSMILCGWNSMSRMFTSLVALAATATSGIFLARITMKSSDTTAVITIMPRSMACYKPCALGSHFYSRSTDFTFGRSLLCKVFYFLFTIVLFWFIDLGEL